MLLAETLAPWLGQRIEIELVTGGRLHGVVREVSENGVVIESGITGATANQSVALADMQLVTQPRIKPRVRHWWNRAVAVAAIAGAVALAVVLIVLVGQQD